MSKRPFAAGALCALLVVSSSSVLAEVIVYEVPLTTGQAIPTPVGAEDARGHATVTLDTETGRVDVTGSYSGMSSNVVAAHIHGPAPAGETAGTIATLGHDGGTEGELILVGGTFSAQNVEQMLDGLMYVNVHTANNGPAEIRGQIVPGDPIPKVPAIGLWGAAFLLAALAAAGLLALRRQPAGSC